MKPVQRTDGTRESSLTIHEHRGRGASAASDNVFGHTGVVARVRHPGLPDDEIVVGCDEEVGVTLWVENVFIPLPLHLKTYNSTSALRAGTMKPLVVDE